MIKFKNVFENTKAFAMFHVLLTCINERYFYFMTISVYCIVANLQNVLVAVVSDFI